MSLLSPWYLLGLAAVIAPIWLHRRRLAVRSERPFPTLRFLDESPPRAEPHRSVDRPLLLAVRCLALLLFALAFATPFRSSAESADAEAHAGPVPVLLVDVSASMRRPGLSDEVRSRVTEWLVEHEESQRAEVCVFDATVRLVVDADQWATGVPHREAIIKACAPTWQRGDLRSAVEVAARKHPETGCRVTVITDAQASGVWEAFDPIAVAHGTEVRMVRVTCAVVTNASLIRQASQRRDELMFRVSNSALSNGSEFVVVGDDGTEMPIDVPPGESRTVTFDVDSGTTFRLAGDAVTFDNEVFVASEPIVEQDVLAILPDDGLGLEERLLYLPAAFPNSAASSTTVRTQSPSEPLLLSRSNPPDLIIVATAIPTETAETLREAALRGTPIVFAPDRAEDYASVVSLLDIATPQAISSAPVAGYTTLVDIDFTDPLFTEFGGPGFSDFSSLHFRKPYAVAADWPAGSRIVARFDDGSPAWVSTPLGEGVCHCLLASWSPDDSDLVRSSRFAPLLNRIVELHSRHRLQKSGFVVGDEVDGQILPPPRALSSEGEVRLAAHETTASEQAVSTFEQPGLFLVRSSETPQRSRAVAVNLPPEETDDQVLSAAEERRLFATSPAVEGGSHDAKEITAANENTGRIRRGILLAILLLIAAESLLGVRADRRLQTEEVSR